MSIDGVDLEHELGVTSLSKLKNVTEKDLIHVGVVSETLTSGTLEIGRCDVESADESKDRRRIQSDEEAAVMIQNLFRKMKAGRKSFNWFLYCVRVGWELADYYYNEKTGGK